MMIVKSFYIAFGIDPDKETPKSYFSSEDREKVEAWVANGGRRPKGTAPNHEADEPSVTAQVDDEASPFETITRNFLASIDRLSLIIPTTMAVLPRLERSHLNQKLYKPLAKVSERISKTDGFEIYECGFDQLKNVRSVGLRINQLKSGRSQLPAMFLMGLVSSYDAFLSELMRQLFLAKPEMLSASDKNISFKDLVELGSVEAARNQILEKEIETFLRQSHHAQFDWLESRLGITLRKDLDIWPKFVEICERRNLFTHTNGVVSKQYLQVCAANGVVSGDVSIGDQLTISGQYLRASLDAICELGWKLTQVLWRKLKPGETARAASALNGDTFYLLEERRFGLARKMIEFGLNLKKQGDELTRKMMVVNLAIALKCGDEQDRAMKILREEDWSASSDKFQICVAAVMGDVDKVVRLMPTLPDTEIDKDAFRDWPAFQWMATEQKFVQAFEQRFGEPFVADQDSQDVPNAKMEMGNLPSAP